MCGKMTTLVHKTVGEARIREICKENGLSEDDIVIINKILEEWKFLIGRNDEKIESFLRLTENNPHREGIAKALFSINLEFFKKRMHPDPNC